MDIYPFDLEGQFYSRPPSERFTHQDPSQSIPALIGLSKSLVNLSHYLSNEANDALFRGVGEDRELRVLQVATAVHRREEAVTGEPDLNWLNAATIPTKSDTAQSGAQYDVWTELKP